MERQRMSQIKRKKKTRAFGPWCVLKSIADLNLLSRRNFTGKELLIGEEYPGSVAFATYLSFKLFRSAESKIKIASLDAILRSIDGTCMANFWVF